jgi:cell division protein FtsW (lipid II flippase)
MTDTKPDNIPDKAAYQVNRRMMCWAALGLMAATVICVLWRPENYTNAPVGPIFYGLSGLVAVYFGATSFASAKGK